MYIWLVVSTPLKNMKVSWDDYSQSMKSHKVHVPNHQPDIYIYVCMMETWYMDYGRQKCHGNPNGMGIHHK